jgi:hypothetical protein
MVRGPLQQRRLLVNNNLPVQGAFQDSILFTSGFVESIRADGTLGLAHLNSRKNKHLIIESTKVVTRTTPIDCGEEPFSTHGSCFSSSVAVETGAFQLPRGARGMVWIAFSGFVKASVPQHSFPPQAHALCSSGILAATG